MTQKELAEKVALLKDGQLVEIDGLMIRAFRSNEIFAQNPCTLCNVDCLCHGDIAKICDELHFMSKSSWFLFLKA